MIIPGPLSEMIKRAQYLWLFLDYDGTLADFAPTPDIVVPDPEVAEIVRQLAEHPRIHVAIISGRRLDQIIKLVPVDDILRAGTYGLEILSEAGETIHRTDYQQIRPVLETLKPRWDSLIEEKKGFFLEDKGWALALHARWANEDEASDVITRAAYIAKGAAPPDVFRILGGDRFLECGPISAHKGKTVSYLMDRQDMTGWLPLYIGDDDKDEEAFEVIIKRGGYAVLVSETMQDSLADYRLSSPREARHWLKALLDSLPHSEGSESHSIG